MRFDQSKFRWWLEGLPSGYVVGRRRDCSDCPLVRFGESTVGQHVMISKSEGFYRVDRKRKVAAWAARFIEAVDAWDINIGQDSYVTAAQALAHLDQIGGANAQG